MSMCFRSPLHLEVLSCYFIGCPHTPAASSGHRSPTWFSFFHALKSSLHQNTLFIWRINCILYLRVLLHWEINSRPMRANSRLSGIPALFFLLWISLFDTHFEIKLWLSHLQLLYCKRRLFWLLFTLESTGSIFSWVVISNVVQIY